MTTLPIEIKNKDKGFVKEPLNNIGVKVKSEPASDITAEIAEALRELKEMQQGKRLSLKDI